MCDGRIDDRESPEALIAQRYVLPKEADYTDNFQKKRVCTMNTLMVVAISLIVALAILFVFLIRVGSGRSTRLPYEQAGPLLTPAERNFFGVLKQVVRDGYLITFKVRIGDVLKVRKGLR